MGIQRRRWHGRDIENEGRGYKGTKEAHTEDTGTQRTQKDKHTQIKEDRRERRDSETDIQVNTGTDGICVHSIQGPKSTEEAHTTETGH